MMFENAHSLPFSRRQQTFLAAAITIALLLSWLIWTFWSRAALLAIGFSLLGSAAIVFSYPKLALYAVAFLVTATPSLMMPKVPMALLSGIVVILLIRKLLVGDFTWRVTPFMQWSLLLFSWLPITLLWAGGYEHWRFSFHLYGVLIIIGVAEAVRTRRDFENVALAAGVGMAVTLLIVLYGLYEAYSSGALLNNISVQGGASIRLFGIWNNPNPLAYSMMPFVGLSISLATMKTLPSWKRASLLLCGLFGCAVIILSLSRGGVLCAGIMLLFIAWKSPYRLRLAGGLVIVILLVISLFPGDVFSRMEDLSTGRADASVNERSLLFLGGVHMIEDSFPWGLGAGATFRYSPDYVMHRLSDIGTHNSYVGLVAESGLIGALLLLGMIYSLFRAVNEPFRTETSGETLTIKTALAGALIAIVIGMSFEDVIGFPAYWFFFTLLSIWPILDESAHTFTPACD